MQSHSSILPFRTPVEVEAAVQRAVAHLRAGRILAYPTETVYGLGGGIEQGAVDSLINLKQRSPDKPFLLLIAGAEMLTRLDLRLTPSAAALAAQFWPGPLTMVLPGGNQRIPDVLRGPQGGIAVRWTPYPGLLRLIEAYGKPITSTSANHPFEMPASSAEDVLKDWEREVSANQILLLDGGELPPCSPSTVVNCMESRPSILRHGAISAEALREVIPDMIIDS
jgi:L-threonylcarbamoyladenylate synthase